MSQSHRSLPLNDLSDDEQSFRDLVRAFAEERIRPLVRTMDEASSIPRELVYDVGGGKMVKNVPVAPADRARFALRRRSER